MTRLVAVLPHLLGLLRRLALGAAEEPISRVLLLVVQRDSRVGIVEIWITMSSVILWRLLLSLPISRRLLILSLQVIICTGWNRGYCSGTRPMNPHTWVLILHKTGDKDKTLENCEFQKGNKGKIEGKIIERMQNISWLHKIIFLYTRLSLSSIRLFKV